MKQKADYVIARLDPRKGSESNNRDKMSLQHFLYGHVPWTYGLWQMRRFGLVLPNPEIKKQKEEYGVGGFTYLYKKK